MFYRLEILINRRIHLGKLTIMVFPLLEYAFYLKNIHLCLSWIKWCFLHLKKKMYPKIIHLCTSWKKWYFVHLKMFSTRRIYTSLQTFFNFFNEQYLPLCELTNVVFSSLEKDICQKIIHICANIYKIYLMKNINLCASWLKWYFLHL